MPDPYAVCTSCNYSFDEPDLDEQGVRIKCPQCGSTGRHYLLEVSDAIHLTESVSVKLDAIIEDPSDLHGQFDVEKEIDGKTIIQYSNLVSEKLIEFFHKNPIELKRINRRLFEELVAELFNGFGYKVELTKQTRDGGKDIIAIKRTEVEVKYLIECKRPDPGGYVGVAPVRELYGVKVSEGATKAILATTAYFSPTAKILFNKHKWELEPRDYDDLKEWLRLYLKIIGKSAS
jgi:restriction endonuclease Mrr